MMSLAISMMAGVKQTKLSLVSSDMSTGQARLEDVSFAKSFNESVAVGASSQEKSAADDVAIALAGLKDTTPARKLEEVAEKPAGAKGNSIAAKPMPVPSEMNTTVARTIVALQTTTEPQEKITANYVGPKKVDVPAQLEGIAGDVSPIPEAPAPGATDEKPEPHVSTADGNRPLAPPVLIGDSPAVQRGTEAAEEAVEGTSSKKPVKAQENSGSQKTLQKTVRKLVDGIAFESKPIAGISTESAIPVRGQVVAQTVPQEHEIGNAIGAPNKLASPATKPAIGSSLVAVEGQAGKDTASAAKSSLNDTAITATAEGGLVSTPKTDVSPQRLTVVAMAGGSDSETKPQAASEAEAALIHSMGVAPTDIVSGNAPGELAATKLPVEDTGGHTAGLMAGSKEQEGPGLSAQSMNGAPRMLAATPTSLEVGIQNGTHGWLKVRAEMTDGGVVNASVSAASSSGQEMLHRELPALTAYLQQEKVAVNAVTVHAPPAAGADARSSSGTDGTGGQTPQRSNEGERQHQSVRRTTLNGSDETVPFSRLHGIGEDGSLPPAAYVNGGTWLSVRA